MYMLFQYLSSIISIADANFKAEKPHGRYVLRVRSYDDWFDGYRGSRGLGRVMEVTICFMSR